MAKLLAFLGSSLGGYVGWAAGAPVGLTTAFMLSAVGTGAGVYAGRRVARWLES